MPEGIVRCPYCVLGGEFRRMLRRSKDCYICLSCGHRTSLGLSYVKCACPKCQKMDMIAHRCRSESVRASVRRRTFQHILEVQVCDE